MASTTSDLFSSRGKSQLDNPLGVWNALNLKAVEEFSKLIDLNLNVLRSSLEESPAKVQEFLSIPSKNMLDFFSLSASQAQPSLRKLISYGNEAANIASSIRDQFLKATRLEMAEAENEVKSMLDTVVEREADGVNRVLSASKSAVETTQEMNGRSPKAAASKRNSASKKAGKHVPTHQVSHSKKASAGATKKANMH